MKVQNDHMIQLKGKRHIYMQMKSYIYNVSAVHVGDGAMRNYIQV